MKTVMNFGKLLTCAAIFLGIIFMVFENFKNGDMKSIALFSGGVLMYILSIIIERSSGCKSGIIGFPIGFFNEDKKQKGVAKK